jgi:Zn-dependent protease
MDVSHLVQTIAIYALPVLLAITLHEAAHGYVARHFGDMTAFAQGRISVNPIRHIDVVGTIVAPLLILLLSHGKFLFGWAKPVPVNYSALRKPKQHMAWVAAAGPGANLLMAIVWAALLRVGISLSDRADAWLAIVKQYGAAGLVDVVLQHGSGAAEFLIGVAAAGMLVNLVLMLLNLLPIPPLDGGRIVTSLLPPRAAWRFARIEPWGLPILLLLLVTNVLGVVLMPLFNETEALIRAFVLL